MIDIDIVLLLLKLAVVVLLYVFIWWVVRAAVGSVRGAAAAASAAPDVMLGRGPEPDYSPSPGPPADVGPGSVPLGPARLAEPRLTVEQSPVLAAGSVFRVTAAITIGRLPHNDIVLTEKVVSSEHARLAIEEGRLFVEDLGSTNGTFVDGRQVAEAPLSPGSRLRVGHTTFRVEA